MKTACSDIKTLSSDIDIYDTMLDFIGRMINIDFPEFHLENVGHCGDSDFTSPVTRNQAVQNIGGARSHHWRTAY